MNVHMVLQTTVGGEFMVTYVTHMAVMDTHVLAEETPRENLHAQSALNPVEVTSVHVTRDVTMLTEDGSPKTAAGSRRLMRHLVSERLDCTRKEVVTHVAPVAG